VAGASNGRAAVSVAALCGGPALLSYAPAPLGSADNRAELDALITRAAGKLGFRRDGRAGGGWVAASRRRGLVRLID